MRTQGTSRYAGFQQTAGHVFARIAAFERNLLLGGGAAALLFLSGCGDTEADSTATETAPAEAAAPEEVVAVDPAEAYANLPRLEGEATVVITVNGRPITVKVDGEKAPITAGNFIDLAKKEVYNDTIFHRVVREPEPFVVQGGDPQGKDQSVPVSALGTGSYMDEATGQARYIPLEILPQGEDEPLYSTTFSQAQLTKPPALTHKRGAVAMARSQFPDSASAQFYFTLGDVNFLDGEYAVFGEVLEGMDVVDDIQQGDVIESVVVVDGADNFKAGS